MAEIGLTTAKRGGAGVPRKPILDPMTLPTARKVGRLRLEPASTAVPAAAAEQQNENYNNEKCVGIHVRLPSLRVFGMLRISQPGTRIDNV